MRAFIVLCLMAVAWADKLGYNYKPVGHSDFGLSFTPGGLSGHVSGVGGSHGVGGSYGFGKSHGVGGSLSLSGGSSFAGTVGGFGGGGSGGAASGGNSGIGLSGAGRFNGGPSYAPHVELEKQFYTFTANDEDFTAPHVENQIEISAKKGLRVIFIKGPENNGLENVAVGLAKHIAEQKTAIYVLQKEIDVGSLSTKLNSINSNVNHKPEVHFVKYRTHEDAINAQKAIQSQYDSLGGVSNNINGGEAPVLNFASKSPVATHHSPSSHGSGGISGHHGSSGSIGSLASSGLSGSSNTYVPPSAPSSTYLPA